MGSNEAFHNKTTEVKTMKKEKIKAYATLLVMTIVIYFTCIGADAVSISGRINYLGMAPEAADRMLLSHMVVGGGVAIAFFAGLVLFIDRVLFCEE